MVARSSIALRSDCGSNSALIHETDEPTFITMSGEGDLVVMSDDFYEVITKELDTRSKVLGAETRRIAAAPVYTVDDVRSALEKKYASA